MDDDSVRSIWSTGSSVISDDCSVNFSVLLQIFKQLLHLVLLRVSSSQTYVYLSTRRQSMTISLAALRNWTSIQEPLVVSWSSIMRFSVASSCLYCELLGLVVAMITLVVVEVPIQLALGLGRVALVVLVVLARVEAVALVEAACRRAVLGPVWNIGVEGVRYSRDHRRDARRRPRSMTQKDAARNQSPMHIQQNSYLHWEQDMWLQPWFFSMRVWHFGQRFVLARIQFAVRDGLALLGPFGQGRAAGRLVRLLAAAHAEGRAAAAVGHRALDRRAGRAAPYYFIAARAGAPPQVLGRRDEVLESEST